MVGPSTLHVPDSPTTWRHRTDQHDWKPLTDLADLVDLAVRVGTDLPSALHATIQTATTIGNVCAASVVLRPPGGKPRTVVATNPWAERVDELQLRSPDSPYADVARRNLPTAQCAQISFSGRRSVFAGAAERTGLGSLMVYDCSTAGSDDSRVTFGALNLYSLQPNCFDTSSQASLTLLAGIARLAIALADSTDNARQLQQAIATRDAIGCAKGILMERHGISADDAFARLRRVSNHRNMKLAIVATLIMNDPHSQLAD